MTNLLGPRSVVLDDGYLVIPGQYWDSQMYSGHLILFGRNGTLQWLDWAKFVNSLPIPDELRFVAEAALLGSSHYYSPIVCRLIQDPEVKPVVEDKFRRLGLMFRDHAYDVASSVGTIDNPFPFPHNDSDVHYNSLFVGAGTGVFQLQADDSSRRLSDAPAFDIATKHTTIAIAAGTDGLLEISTRPRSDFKSRLIAANVCTACEWSYASIIGSSQSRSLFVAAFGFVRDEPKNPRNRHKTRNFERLFTQEDLFPAADTVDPNTIQWGANDRLYQYREGSIDVVKNTSNGHASFEIASRHSAPTTISRRNFVDVRAAPFGSVVEFDDRLTVLLNSGGVLQLPGEPVNWRIFPRSLNYLNQLHIIYEDRIEILAITSDYFVAPDERLFGTEPMSGDERT